MIGLFDLGNVISLTGFKSHVLHNLTMPFSNPPAMTLMDTPSGWLEKATEQMISLQWTCPTRSPFTVQSLRSLPPPAETPNHITDHHKQSPWGIHKEHPCLLSDAAQRNPWLMTLNYYYTGSGTVLRIWYSAHSDHWQSETVRKEMNDESLYDYISVNELANLNYVRKY